jgi:hypothetical protein
VTFTTLALIAGATLEIAVLVRVMLVRLNAKRRRWKGRSLSSKRN